MTDIPYAEVQEMIRDAVAKAGSQANFARLAKVSRQSVWLAIQGITPSDEILDAIEVERTKETTVTYRRKAP